MRLRFKRRPARVRGSYRTRRHQVAVRLRSGGQS